MKRSLIVLLALILAGCAHPLASVKHTPARFQASAESRLATAEQDIAAAQKMRQSAPLEAIGKYLNAVETASNRLRVQPNDAAALRDYNFALARVFSCIRSGGLDAWSKPITVPGYTISHPKVTDRLWEPSEYDYTPCDELTIGGTAFTERAHRDGIGAMLLGVRKIPLTDYGKLFYRTAHIYYSVTAVARFKGNHCEITMEDPLEMERVEIAGSTFPLAGDFSTSVAMFLATEKPQKLGFARLLHPDKWKNTTLLYRLQPYDPKKIPILFVHGLQDTSATWMPMFNELLADSEIRDHYQFWFFTYPSGYPFPYSAGLLRHDLDRFHEAYPDHKPIVIIGHSMGGLLTRLMLTDSGDNDMWRYLFNESYAETKMSPEDKELLASTLIFKHRPDINRAIFLSTPHRGSIMASNWIGKIATKLVRLPKTMVEAGKEMTAVANETKGGFHLRRMPNSIDTLSPTSSFVVAMNKRPLAAGIPYHQIIGDRGKGNSPKSSDGVVEYWSSHLDGAQSTLVVPSGHPTHKNPEGIQEVRRILKLHLRGRSANSVRVAPKFAGSP